MKPYGEKLHENSTVAAQIAALQADNHLLRGALEKLLAKPRCPACRRAASKILLATTVASNTEKV